MCISRDYNCVEHKLGLRQLPPKPPLAPPEEAKHQRPASTPARATRDDTRHPHTGRASYKIYSHAYTFMDITPSHPHNHTHTKVSNPTTANQALNKGRDGQSRNPTHTPGLRGRHHLLIPSDAPQSPPSWQHSSPR